MSDLPLAYDVLRKHRIRFVVNAPDGAFMSNCPNPKCHGPNNAVQIHDDAVGWHCRDCGESRIVPLHRPARGAAASADAGNGKAPSAGTQAPPVASVKFMLTAADKLALRALGYTDEQIRGMTPKEGLDIIAQGRRPSADDAERKRELEEAKKEFPDEGEDEPKEAPEDEPKPLLRIIPMPPPDLADIVGRKLKDNPDGPFDAELLEQFARLVREQADVAVRLCKRYPALAADVRLDAATVRAALESAGKEAVAELFAELVALAELSAAETDALLRFVAGKSGAGLRLLARMLKEAQTKRRAQRAQVIKARRRAQRIDPRPIVRAPGEDDPWLPEMTTINDVLGSLPPRAPPTRDIEGVATWARKLVLPKMHAFEQTQSNRGDET